MRINIQATLQMITEGNNQGCAETLWGAGAQTLKNSFT